LVFVGALVAAAPWVDGYYYKGSYTQLLASLAADNPAQIKVVDYSQGWLSSDVTLSIDLNPPNTKKPDPAYVVTVNQHITHGPIAKDPISGGWKFTEAVLQSQMHIDKKTETMVIGSAATDGIVQVDTLASFDGHYQNQVKTPLFTVKISDTGKLTWQGVTGLVDADFTNNKLKHLTSDLTLGALAIQDATGNLSVQDMKVQAERNCQQAVLCGGTSVFSMPSVNGLINNMDMKLVGTSIKSTYGADANNAYNATLDIQMAKLTMPDYTVGPVGMKFAMNNVNAASLSKLLDISKSVADSPSEDRQSAGLLLLAEYNKELPHLIMANTVINQDTTVTTTYGDFTSVAKFYWPANTPLPASSQDFIKMNFKVDMRAATTLVDKVVNAIDAKKNGTEVSTVVDAASAKVEAPAPVAEAAPAPVPVTAPVAAHVDAIKDILGPYVGVGPHKISPEIITVLHTLVKQHFAPGIYNASVDKIIMVQHLPKPQLMMIAEQLKDQYSSTFSEFEASDTATADAAPPAPDAAAALPAPAVAPTPAVRGGATSGAGQLKQQLDAMIKQGFVKQDKDDYVVSIVYDGATMQINGATIPLPIPGAAETTSEVTPADASAAPRVTQADASAAPRVTEADPAVAATNAVAGAFAASSAENYAVRSGKSSAGMAISNCTDIANLVHGGLPSGYTIVAAAVAPGVTVQCKLIGPSSTSATIAATGIR
jgi:hypothetical protein